MGFTALAVSGHSRRPARMQSPARAWRSGDTAAVSGLMQGGSPGRVDRPSAPVPRRSGRTTDARSSPRTYRDRAGQAEDPVSETTAAIHTIGLTKRYGATLALDDLDLTVASGEAYGYLGPNGAGKTTTIRLLLGLHRPSAGRAEIFGADAWAQAVPAHRRAAYVSGEPYLWPTLTGAETFALLANLHGGADASYRTELVRRFELDEHKRIRALSKGNRQKVQLIAGLATRAELLLFDEPTSGLDPLMEMVFRDCVHEATGRGQTVFLSSHILSEVEATCDRGGILKAGRLVDEGTLSDLR